MKHYFIFLFLISCAVSNAQNLVPNGDFEQYDTCQNGLGQLYRAKYWFNPISPISSSSPDYYNACNVNSLLSVPENAGGYELARSGDGYCSICIGARGGFVTGMEGNFREYLEVELTDTLIAGTTYCIQFFVSACDSMNYTSNNIGVYFSDTVINYSCGTGGCYLPYIPQFENTFSNSLNSRVGWTEVSGNYIASGGEKYMVIGNFRDSSNTNMTFTNWTLNTRKEFAVYYIDDASLIKCDTVTNVIHNAILFFKVYPNPSSGLYNIKSENKIIEKIEVLDIIGNIIYDKTDILRKETDINLVGFSNGIYFLKLKIANENTFYQFRLIKN